VVSSKSENPKILYKNDTPTTLIDSPTKKYPQVPGILSNIIKLCRLPNYRLPNNYFADGYRKLNSPTTANSILEPQIVLTRIDKDSDFSFTPNPFTGSSKATATQDNTDSISKTTSSPDLPDSNPEDIVVAVLIYPKSNPPPKKSF
ncbi:unnamed protein product, partial [Allacma fusca]